MDKIRFIINRPRRSQAIEDGEIVFESLKEILEATCREKDAYMVSVGGIPVSQGKIAAISNGGSSMVLSDDSVVKKFPQQYTREVSIFLIYQPLRPDCNLTHATLAEFEPSSDRAAMVFVDGEPEETPEGPRYNLCNYISRDAVRSILQDNYFVEIFKETPRVF